MSDDTTPDTRPDDTNDTSANGQLPPYAVQVPQPYRNTPYESLPPAIQQQIRNFGGGSAEDVEPGASESADETEAMAEATREAGQRGSDVPPPGSTSQAAQSGLIDVAGLNQADGESDTAATLEAGRENATETAADVSDTADKPKPGRKLP